MAKKPPESKPGLDGLQQLVTADSTFTRPDEEQRQAFLKPVLEELGFSPHQVRSLVAATDATNAAERLGSVRVAALRVRVIAAIMRGTSSSSSPPTATSPATQPGTPPG